MLQQLRADNQKGFTLIELMIVVAIIGILSAIAIPNFLSYLKTGANEAAKAEARSFYTCCLADFAGLELEADTTYSSGTLPGGFTKNGDITYGGTLVIDADGTVSTCTMNFKSQKGDKTYTLAANGGITGA